LILLLGATGYVGQSFARALRRRKDSFIPLSRNAFDYTKFEFLFDYVRKIRPELVINAAEYSCSEDSGEDCPEVDRLEMLQANSLLPQTISRVCAMTNTPWGHVSSGSIYTGARVLHDKLTRIEKNLTQLRIHDLFDLHPEAFFGFSEEDEPNFCFKHPPCTFYSGTKALAEESIRNQGQSYIWRLRLAFNEEEDPSNFLLRAQRWSKIHDAIESLSHLDDCVGACLQLWDRRAPFGVYNVVNPGAITTREVITMIQQILRPAMKFKCLEDDEPSRENEAPNSHCILDGSKLFKAGIRLRQVKEALEYSLQKLQSQHPALMKSAAQRLSVGGLG